MRVAIWIVFGSFFIAAGVQAAPAIEASVYPASAMLADVSNLQVAKPAPALQQGRTSPSVMSGPAAGPTVRASQARDVDRRLAALDPTSIVYERATVPVTQTSLLELGSARLFPRQEQALRPTHTRSTGDFMLMGFAALMLIAYQLRKKHRFLRPHPFSY